jgi:spermidine synthase
VGEVFGKFSWPNARLPASLAGLGFDPYAALVDLHSEPPYAVIGLGTGTLAAHARPLQTVHFYEIDPLVRDLSLPPGERKPVFYFLKDALARGAHLDVILGDGRLQIDKAPAGYYHMIMLDAFSSDAIPVHLLTKEALQVYFDKLVDGGVLIFNTTNRYVQLPNVLSALAQDLGLECLYCGDYSDKNIPDKYAADWLVMQRRTSAPHFANGNPPVRERLDPKRWEDVEPLDGPVWTDNYSNLFRVMKLR